MLMLFRKNHPTSCEYCANGAKLNDESVLCAKRGITAVRNKCRKFVYDPCKRIPPKAKGLDFGKYKEEDFSL